MVLLRYLKGVLHLPVLGFEANIPPRRPETACWGNFLHSSFLLLPSKGTGRLETARLGDRRCSGGRST